MLIIWYNKSKMSIQNKIIEFNKSLLDDESICDIVKYIKEINGRILHYF
jgi:hypothetical protein